MPSVGEHGGARGRPRTWAEIDGEAFAANVESARARSPGGRLLAVLKANAYGHGAVHLAPLARAAGACMLGVGDSTEALELRAAGVDAPILVLGALVPSEIAAVVEADVTPVLHSEGRLRDLEDEARRQGRRVPVHLKVDSGMGRLGVQPSRLLPVALRAQASPHLEVQGIMSHLAGAGEAEQDANRAQARAFSRMVAALAARGIRPRDVHLRNSAGLRDEGVEASGETLARAGALLYGFASEGGVRPRGFAPVLSLRTQIVFLKDVPAGAPIGYGGTFVTSRVTRLAVIPVGYHDGVMRSLGNCGEALVRGRRTRIVGQISMDYSTLDITDVPGAQVGDDVTLIGSDGPEHLSVEDVASAAGTLPYEILCGLGPRVVRLAALRKAALP